MPARRSAAHRPATVALRLELADEPGSIAAVVAAVASTGGALRNLATVRRTTDPSDRHNLPGERIRRASHPTWPAG
jgi:hypothetical protein